MATVAHGGRHSPAPANGRGANNIQTPTQDPHVIFRTLLTKVSQQLSKPDVEQLSFINNLPSTETPRTSLDVLRELEKRGVYSYDKIDPLITLLTNITRVDIINSCRLREYKESATFERRAYRQLTPRHSERSFVHHTGGPVLEANSDPCLYQGNSPPDDYIIHPSHHEDTTSPSSIATPPSITQLNSMSVECKRHLLQQLACDPESKAFMEELVGSERDPAASGETLNSTTQGTSGIAPPMFNLSHDMSHDLSAGGVASQPVDELLSSNYKTPSSMVLESLPPSYHHHYSSVSTSISKQSDQEASLPTQQNNVSSLSTSGIGSDLSPLDGPLFMKQMSNVSTASHDVKSLDSPVEEFVSIPHDAYRTNHGSISSATFDEDYPAINKTLAKWKWKRTDLCEPIYKHSSKSFSKEVKMKSSPTQRSKDITLTFVLTPYGLKDNAGCCMTMTVKVDVCKRSKQMKEMAQLHLRITSQTQGGTEFLFAKNEMQKLETFTIHDYLPHSVVKESHSRHVEFCVEAYLTHEP